MLATSTAAFGIELIAVVGNGGFWTIQLLSSTTAAFEMPSFTTPAIELIQKPAFPTSAFGSVISRAFFSSSYSDCPSDAAIVVPLLLRSSCPFSPSLLLLFLLLLLFQSPPSPFSSSSSSCLAPSLSGRCLVVARFRRLLFICSPFFRYSK